MRINVDLPAPFSPTSAWISPPSTRSETLRLAASAPKVLVMPRSSIALACARSVMGALGRNSNLAGDDVRAQPFGCLAGRFWNQPRITCIVDITDARLAQPEDAHAAPKFPCDDVPDRLEHGDIRSFQHRGQDLRGRFIPLVGIHADGQFIF